MLWLGVGCGFFFICSGNTLVNWGKIVQTKLSSILFFSFTYRRGKVPDVLLTTIELPEGVSTTGKGCLLQAYVCRPKRDCRGELHAKEISDGLPFLEYELHRLLINKLKVKGMNSIFGLKVNEIHFQEQYNIGLFTVTSPSYVFSTTVYKLIQCQCVWPSAHLDVLA